MFEGRVSGIWKQCKGGEDLVFAVNIVLVAVNFSDFPELKAARTPSPVQVICTSGEPDYKR
jgi:hypothetical protein